MSQEKGSRSTITRLPGREPIFISSLLGKGRMSILKKNFRGVIKSGRSLGPLDETERKDQEVTIKGRARFPGSSEKKSNGPPEKRE